MSLRGGGGPGNANYIDEDLEFIENIGYYNQSIDAYQHKQQRIQKSPFIDQVLEKDYKAKNEQKERFEMLLMKKKK